MGALLHLLACYILFVNVNDAARILAVFPTPSISHQVVFRPVTQELVRRGHHVTVITTDPAFPKGGAPANLTEIDVHDISYGIWKELFMTAPKGGKDDIVHHLKIFLNIFIEVFEAQTKTENVQRLIKNRDQKFDLIIVEACYRLGLGFRHIYEAPVVYMSSLGGVFGNFEVIGAPTHPTLYPTSVRQRLNNLTMWEKFTELYNHYTYIYMYYVQETAENNLLKKVFGPDAPTISELYNHVEMLFLNENPVFVGSRPVPPTVVYMGGLHQNPQKELPKDLKSYLDSSKNGVIYISFGTNVDPTLLPADRIQVLVKVFSQLPYDVLWKWNGDELPGRTANIRISKWLPQSDLLRHPKVKLFVTQGGLQSTDEAITAGVPLIGIPMLGDQWYNAEKYESHKIGVRLDLDAITEENFKEAINRVIGDDSYRKNIIKLRTLMRDQPMSPLDRTMWSLEHLLRHGGAKHLRSPAANISWAEYLELELVLTLLGGMFTVISLVVFGIYYLFKFFLRSKVADVKVKRS
ncbi:UDP-glucuronosyltransferase 2B31-like [Trichoplusia ni]|uniref:UDP-glucuronosyltransferase n=1 Tax=Trichoplusia ni TaxID=7111 RepID=A0A7E5W5U4_TRINI|nr:UDP-glucuronosyltransferase 2B31-like [Trichoplusia ni]